MKNITLVIDDGPSEVTPLLVSTLKEHGHRAVLFVLGGNVSGREEMLIEALKSGFALGNHSFHHPHFSEIDVAAARREIETTDALLEDLYARARVRRPAKWFRFPYLDTGGERAAEMQELLRSMGFQRPSPIGSDPARIDWPTTLCTFDWEIAPVEKFRGLVEKAQAGEVLEFHDKAETVPLYLDALVEVLARRSLRARVPE